MSESVMIMMIILREILQESDNADDDACVRMV